MSSLEQSGWRAYEKKNTTKKIGPIQNYLLQSIIENIENIKTEDEYTKNTARVPIWGKKAVKNI